MNRLKQDKLEAILCALVEGNSVRSTARMVGVSKNTVLRFVRDFGKACLKYHLYNVRNLNNVYEIQCDEIWGFCYAKKRNVPLDKKGVEGFGDVWTWIALDVDSRFIVSWMASNRDERNARIFIRDIANRATNLHQITTDALHAYSSTVKKFLPSVHYGVLEKVYGYKQPVHRYSPATKVWVKKKAMRGMPDFSRISTSYIERQNLNIRMCVRRLTRLTNAFSKKFENMKCALAIYFMFYNFCKVHGSLGTTPAVACGVATSPWSLSDLLKKTQYHI